MNLKGQQHSATFLAETCRGEASGCLFAGRVRPNTLRTLAGFSLLTAVLALAPAVLASGAADVYSYQSLETLLGRTNLAPRAYVTDQQIRLYFAEEARCWMFKAAWEHPRAAAQEFSYASATLEAGKSLRRMPEPPSRWREVKVLTRAESDRFLRGVAGRLVPAESGHGVYCRYAFGDAVLFRNASNQVQLVAYEELPAGVVVDRRYNRHELASATAAALETDLAAAYPAQSTFVLTMGRGSRLRLVLLELAEREVVVLYVPPRDDEARPPVHFGSRLSTLGSFILVDTALAFVKNPLSSSARTLNQWLQWPLTLLIPRVHAGAFTIPPLTNAPGMDLAAWEQWLDRHTSARREQGSIRLLVDGDQFFPLFKRRVAEAQSAVDVRVCIFDRDDVGVEVADQLKQRSTNVQVRVVFDRLMTRAAGVTPPATPMREGFVPPRAIGPYLRQNSKVQVRPQANPGFTADHSKILLVDGRYAYLGGMNLGREYRYEWHDLMAEVQGPVVASLQRQFDKKWAQQGLWGDCGLAAEAACGKSESAEAPPEGGLIELRRLYTRPFGRQIRRAELAAINRASSYVFAENPYFFSNDLLNALVRARLRGVDVRVVIPSENDLPAGHKSNLVTANYLRENGVRVYLYPGMTHVKAMLVDGWACFGSANFDALSLRFLLEADLATSDPAFASKFRQQLFETDFARSRELKEPLAVGWGDYLADALLSPF